MRWRRLLVPFFMAPLDRYLRNNWPLIWRTRAHVILFYSLLPINILCYLWGHFREIDLAHTPTGPQLLLQVSGLLLAAILFFVFWGHDQRQLPLRSKGWGAYLLTTGLYWLCFLSFGMNILVYLTPVIQRTAALLSTEYVDRAYEIDQKWYECRRCDCPEGASNQATPADHALMLQLAEEMGYDTLREETCDYMQPGQVYLVVEEGYLSRANNFHNRIVSLHNAQAFEQGRGAYYSWFYRLLPLGFLVFGWLGAQWLFLGSVRGSRPRREGRRFFTQRELLDLWIIDRLDRWLLQNHPWWWNVQLHRWLFYVLFWGNLVLLTVAFSLPLRLGSIADDLIPFVLVLLIWILGGVGWFIGWVYDRSLQVVVRKDLWRNLLLVLGYLVAFYALLFNVGIFSAAMAFRLDRLLSDEQLVQDMRYRMDNLNLSDNGFGFLFSSSQDEARLFEWRDRSGFDDYFFLGSSFDPIQTERMYKLKRKAEAIPTAAAGITPDTLNRRLLAYANQMINDGMLDSIPEVAPGDPTIDDRLQVLDTRLKERSEVAESLVDSIVAARIQPLERELEQLQQSNRSIRGNDYLGWYLGLLKERQVALKAALDLVYNGLAEMDRFIEDRLLSVMDSLMQVDPVKTQQTRDSLLFYRQQFLGAMGYGEVPPGLVFEDFLPYSTQGLRYSSVSKEIKRLEQAQDRGGYQALSHEEQKILIAERKNYLEQEIANISRSRYRLRSEWLNQQMGPIESEIRWLRSLRGPGDYFNYALGLFITRHQEKTLNRPASPSATLREIERQAAEMATLNTQYFPEVVLEVPVDLCEQLEVLKIREGSIFFPEMDRQENLELLDFGCRYRLQKDSRLARAANWVADRLFDTDLTFHYASKLAPSWATVLEAKNFRSRQGIVYNLLTLYIPLYALPFVLTYIFLAISFYYFSPAAAGLTALATLFFFIFLSFLPNRFIFEDPIWVYLFIGVAAIGYGFFERGNYPWLDYGTLAWFLCSPLLLVISLTDQWGSILVERLTINEYSLATEPAGILWLVWGGYLLANLLVVWVGIRIFTRQAYLPE